MLTITVRIYSSSYQKKNRNNVAKIKVSFWGILVNKNAKINQNNNFFFAETYWQVFSNCKNK